MNQEKLNFAIDPTIKEIVVREGEAQVVHEPRVVAITGTLDAPAIYAASRTLDPKECHVIANKSTNKIGLYIKEHDHYQDQITGSLNESKHLELFFINKGKTFGLQDLIKLVKRTKFLFAKDTARDQHAELLKNLMNFSSQAQINLNKSNDNRGNISNNFERTVKTDIPLNFILDIAIFEGYEKRKFFVEICLDQTESTVQFWLESAELFELYEAEKEKIFSDVLSKLSKFPIIHQ